MTTPVSHKRRMPAPTEAEAKLTDANKKRRGKDGDVLNDKVSRVLTILVEQWKLQNMRSCQAGLKELHQLRSLPSGNAAQAALSQLLKNEACAMDVESGSSAKAAEDKISAEKRELMVLINTPECTETTKKIILRYAVKHYQEDLIQELLEKHIDLSEHTDENIECMMDVAQTNPKIVRLFLKHKANVTGAVVTENDGSFILDSNFLKMAVDCNDLALAQELIAAGASVDNDEEADHSLVYAAGRNFEITKLFYEKSQNIVDEPELLPQVVNAALKNNQVQTAKFVLDKNAGKDFSDIIVKLPEYVSERNLDAIKCLGPYIDKEEYPYELAKALMKAILLHDEDATRELLRIGANPSQAFFAYADGDEIQFNNYEEFAKGILPHIEAFLKWGADINAIEDSDDEVDHTMLATVFSIKCSKQLSLPDLKKITDWFLSKGVVLAKPDCTEYMISPLMAATFLNLPELLNGLLEKIPADLKQQEIDRAFAYQVSRKERSMDSIKCLGMLKPTNLQKIFERLEVNDPTFPLLLELGAHIDFLREDNEPALMHFIRKENNKHIGLIFNTNLPIKLKIDVQARNGYGVLTYLATQFERFQGNEYYDLMTRIDVLFEQQNCRPSLKDRFGAYLVAVSRTNERLMRRHILGIQGLTGEFTHEDLQALIDLQPHPALSMAVCRALIVHFYVREPILPILNQVQLKDDALASLREYAEGKQKGAVNIADKISARLITYFVNYLDVFSTRYASQPGFTKSNCVLSVLTIFRADIPLPNYPGHQSVVQNWIPYANRAFFPFMLLNSDIIPINDEVLQWMQGNLSITIPGYSSELPKVIFELEANRGKEAEIFAKLRPTGPTEEERKELNGILDTKITELKDLAKKVDLASRKALIGEYLKNATKDKTKAILLLARMLVKLGILKETKYLPTEPISFKLKSDE